MDTLNLANLAQHFSDPEAARLFLEAQRWPNGPVCPHCDSAEVYKLTPKESKKGKHVRPGVYKCAKCREHRHRGYDLRG